MIIEIFSLIVHLHLPVLLVWSTKFSAVVHTCGTWINNFPILELANTINNNKWLEHVCVSFQWKWKGKRDRKLKTERRFFRFHLYKWSLNPARTNYFFRLWLDIQELSFEKGLFTCKAYFPIDNPHARMTATYMCIMSSESERKVKEHINCHHEGDCDQELHS